MSAREEFIDVPDYGAEIVPGARVMDLSGRRGIVVVIRDRCHWNCNESARQWRPRSAYVEWDGQHGAGYAEPDGLSRIPAAWGPGLGLIHAPERPRGKHMFMASCVRLLVRSDGDRPSEEHEWHLMNKPDKGWASLSIPYRSWASLLADWNIERGEPGRDEHGVFIPVANAARSVERAA